MAKQKTKPEAAPEGTSKPQDIARCYRVATLLAMGWGVETVAEAVGVGRTTIYTWRQQPWWAEVVETARVEYPPAKALFEKAFRRVCHELDNNASADGASFAMGLLGRLMPELKDAPAAGPATTTRLTVTLEQIGEGNAMQLLSAVQAVQPRALPEDDDDR